MPEDNKNTLEYEENTLGGTNHTEYSKEDSLNTPGGISNISNLEEDSLQNTPGSNLNTKYSTQNTVNVEEDNQSISGGFKKTSVAIPLDLVALIDAQPMKQSQVMVESLRFYFSDARIKLAEYQRSISEYEKKQIDSEKNLAVLQAQAQSQASTLEFLKVEFERLHTLLDEQKDLSKAHMAQVQSMLEDRKKQDYLLQQKEEKILQLEEAANQKEAEFEEKSKKKNKWKFWK